MSKRFFSPMLGWKNPNFKSENIKEKTIVFSSKLCLKLFVYLDSRWTFPADYRHISRATTMQILSLHYKGPRVLCPLTIGISAVVYFFASTGNFPCKYNNQLKLVLRCIKR